MRRLGLPEPQPKDGKKGDETQSEHPRNKLEPTPAEELIEEELKEGVGVQVFPIHLGQEVPVRYLMVPPDPFADLEMKA